MTSRERVLTALACQEPDRIPYCEFGIDRPLADRILEMPVVETDKTGIPEEEGPFSASEARLLAEALGLDNLTYTLRPRTFARKATAVDGQEYFVEGLIRTHDDLGIVQLTNPEDESTVGRAREFADHKGPYAACLSSRAGLTPVVLGMGMEHFCVCLQEDPELVEALLDLYVDWAVGLARRAPELGYDCFQTSDDMAFKTGLFFSPETFRRLLLPRYRKIADVLEIPWIFHSDGDIQPVIEDLIDLGVCAIHPVEPLAMDIVALKRRFGDRLCLMGNIDLGLLAEGSPADVETEVRRLIEHVGPNGGYILTSGNSLAHYLKPDNVLAMATAVKTRGAYPIDLG